jgi:hypothetical protein
MTLINRVWTYVTYLVSCLTLSPIQGLVDQSVLTIHDPFPIKEGQVGGPVFKPPGGDPKNNFQCDYTNMKGYKFCSTPGNRGCWLTNPTTKDTYDINTNYEIRTPNGTVREYTMDLLDSNINVDGVNFPYAKLFNGKYPGPWIQACWGDVCIHFINCQTLFLVY